MTENAVLLGELCHELRDDLALNGATSSVPRVAEESKKNRAEVVPATRANLENIGSATDFHTIYKPSDADSLLILHRASAQGS